MYDPEQHRFNDFQQMLPYIMGYLMQQEQKHRSGFSESPAGFFCERQDPQDKKSPYVIKSYYLNRRTGQIYTKAK